MDKIQIQIGGGELKFLKINLLECQFVQHKSCMDQHLENVKELWNIFHF